uniref:PAS domain-containing protein n=1 Tax=Pararhodobacter sp. SW119 TaxID=2780075 RepID=UPI001ADFCDBA
EALPQIVWTARPDGTVDWVNSEFLRYTGFKEIDPATGDWLLAVHPDDREPTLEVWAQTIARGKPYRTDFRIWCAAENRWRAHLVDARPHHDGEGRVLRWFGIATDIQEIRDADAERETELRLRAVESQILEQVSAGDEIAVIIESICAKMGSILDGARVSVALVSEDGQRLEKWFATDLPDAWCRAVANLPVAEGEGACGTAAHRRAPVISADIARDPLWRAYRDQALQHGLAACWSLPVLDAAGRPIASIACYFDHPCAATDGQLVHLRRVGAFIRTAIEHARARDRLHASERRYRSLFDLLPIGISERDISAVQAMIRDLKADGVTDLAAWLDANEDFIDRASQSIRCLDANRAALELRDVENLEELSLKIAGLRRTPTFRASVRKLLLSIFNGESSFEMTYSLTRRDGSLAEIHLRNFLPDPNAGRLLATGLDITEQRRAEERFRHVAQASSDFIFDRDFASETTWVNDAATWLPDYPAGPCEVPRSAWVNSVHPDDNDEILRQIDLAVSGGAGSWEGEYRLRLHDGSYIPVRERSSITRDDTGAPVRMIGNIIDLSEQKALEAQLRQAQRLDAVGQLTGGIAHDFNNLLTVILGNAEMLRDALPADSRAQAMAGHVLAASERAAELTQRLLAFARKQPLSPGHFDPNVLVEGMRMLVERSITPAITLELDLAEGAGPVRLDRAMFESALLNLCVNARDAMPEGGTLRIETRAVALPESDETDAPPPGAYVRITVSDTGTGMDADTMARAFEPFFTTKGTGAGSGLGLSMVYGFVRQSEGHIRIDSTHGKGSAIEILLPRSDIGAEADDTEEFEPTLEANVARARILIVEDEPLVREYTKMTVESLGYRAEALPQAAPALDLLKSGEGFDLLLSDIVMPGGMSGRQLADAALSLHPDLPVLLVSGHSEEMTAPDDRIDPRIGFLRKPFRKRELAHRLAELLGT